MISISLVALDLMDDRQLGAYEYDKLLDRHEDYN